MGELFTHKNMVETLSIRREISLTDSELFFNELCNIIAETLSYGESVTIDGLGTFSLSVATNSEDNENTITNTYKITFIPDPVLAEKSNTPFSHFQRTPLNKGVDFDFIKRVTSLEEESNEFYSEEYIIEEKKESSVVTTETKEFSFEEKLLCNNTEHINLKEETNNIEEDGILEKVNEEDKGKGEDSALTKEQIVESETPTTNSKKTVPIIPLNNSVKEKKKRRKGKLVAVIVLLIVVLSSSVAYYNMAIKTADHVLDNKTVFQDKTKNSTGTNTIQNVVAEKKLSKQSVPENFKISENADGKVNIESLDSKIEEEKSTPKVIENKEDNKDKNESYRRVIITEGKTLRLIALNEYGSRDFWVYIYLENRDKIKNPNIIPAGITIKIPPKSKYAINSQDTISINKARELGLKAEKGELSEKKT